ncbi:hypothetical protein [Deinococcus sp.]|uniref:hypothetical protein n=1 Tax=Deinococcus sp. TaxID=47478 RepID=UPI0028698AA7|nr:hypothetical protein [Deinococcus sp.]
MTRFLALTALILGSALAQTTTTPTWPDLLHPTLEARQAACDAPAAYENAHLSPATLKYVDGDHSDAGRLGRKLVDDRDSPPDVKVPAGVVSRIVMERPLTLIANQCGNAAYDGKTVKVSQSANGTLVYVQGELVAPKDALTMKAALRLLDATGNELNRIDSLRDAAAKVVQALWTRECRDDVCRWRSCGVFRFSAPLNPGIYAATQTVQLVYDRGYGPETRDYTAADFTKASLGGSGQ